MRYFKAKEVTYRPYLIFDFIAESTAALEAMGLTEDPLVVNEDELPNEVYGVSTKKLEGGILVNRAPAELSAAQVEEAAIVKVNEKAVICDKMKVLKIQLLVSTDLSLDTADIQAEYDQLIANYNAL